MIAILVIVLGGLGSIIIHQRIKDVSGKIEKRAEVTANYLQHTLVHSVSTLDAKKMRQYIADTASDELQVVEVFDASGERVYVYERTGTNGQYDLKFERDLNINGAPLGKMIAYFSLREFVNNLRLREFLRLMIMVSAAGLVFGVGIFLFIKKIVLKPIAQTLAFSTELAKGNYNKRIDVNSKDEMGLLQESLNQMADNLQDSVENLKASFYEAEGSRLQALEASRLKSEFLANMSHEIRTPINAIIGFADILLEDEKTEDRRDSLKTIKKSANILLENISDILDFSKLEAGKLKLAKSEILLKELVEEISPIIKLRLHGKDINFNIDIDESLLRPIVCDRIRLRQVLLNILINSTKFTKQGSITLRIEPSDNRRVILYKVTDTGIGISKDRHQKIFEPFIQGDGSITRDYGGTGLGLAIAKRLVEMMNGKIWVESTPNLGSTFYFTVEV
jgi:signal transduction histidine kinase